MAAKSKKPSRRKINLMVVIPAVVAVLIITCCIGLYLKSESVISGTRDSMATYLKNKYGKDFKVERPSLNNGGLGVSGTWSADAYPTDNKEDKFSVMKSEKRDSFADQYTALIWSQRETKRINELVHKNATEWKVDISVSIYLDQPMSNIALPDNPKVEDIIKEENGPSYNVNLRYSDVAPEGFDLAVVDMERITSLVKNEGIRNVNYNYSLATRDGLKKECSAMYNKSFDYSSRGIQNCLNSKKEV